MSNIIDRYAGAVRSSNLRSKADTNYGDPDVLAAAGIAGHASKTREDGSLRPATALGMALLRFFVGGDTEARAVLAILRRMIVGKAYRAGDQLGEAAADLIASLVLQWHRDSVCKPCGGHGYKVAFGGEIGESRAVIGDDACADCDGSGRRGFDSLFPADRLYLAQWLRSEIEREQALAGPAAMKALAPRLDMPLEPLPDL